MFDSGLGLVAASSLAVPPFADTNCYHGSLTLPHTHVRRSSSTNAILTVRTSAQVRRSRLGENDVVQEWHRDPRATAEIGEVAVRLAGFMAERASRGSPGGGGPGGSTGGGADEDGSD